MEGKGNKITETLPESVSAESQYKEASISEVWPKEILIDEWVMFKGRER